MLAASQNQSDAAEALIQLGAPIDLRGVGGRRALHFAMPHKDARILGLRSDPNELDECFWSPLVWAVRLKNARAAQALLDAGGDPWLPPGRRCAMDEARELSHACSSLVISRGEAFKLRRDLEASLGHGVASTRTRSL